jgi:hypothetical protein
MNFIGIILFIFVSLMRQISLLFRLGPNNTEKNVLSPSSPNTQIIIVGPNIVINVASVLGPNTEINVLSLVGPNT